MEEFSAQSTLQPLSIEPATTTQAWPPPYRLRKSARAKHIRLRITSLYGLELIVPHRFKQQDTLAILEEKKDWIQKIFLKINYQPLSKQAITLPTQIQLPAIGQTWLINYETTELATPTLHQTTESTLLVRGNLNQIAGIVEILCEWLLQHAKEYLPPLLAELSEAFALPFNSVKIRMQKNCWGSCTHKKNISLNAKLLFFPPPLVRHILIHELCHTRQLNHSKKFWGLMGQYDPDYLIWRRQLRNANSYLPAWLMLVDS